MTITLSELMPGVNLTSVRTDKFKSSYWSLRLLTPLAESTAAMNALLPSVLRRGTERLPDMTAISAELDEMYGGVVESVVRKCGDVQCPGFEATFLDDAYAPEGERITERAAALLGELLLRPATRNARLRRDYVRGEQENLIRRIRATRNDKRQYAAQRLTELLYAGTNYAVGRLGSLAKAEEIGPIKLYNQYRTLLATAPIELFYCGSVPAHRVELAWREALMGLPRMPDRPEPETDSHRPTEEKVQRFSETMDVGQGKLEMGFRTDEGYFSPLFPALLVVNAMFGGTTNSRLFRHVREECSLCYYASSVMDSLKGYIRVSCGVEPTRFDEAETEIMTQLRELQDGAFSAQEFESARRSVIDSLRTAMDDQGSLCALWLRDRAGGMSFDPENLIRLVADVTEGEAAAAAMQLRLDGVYRLSAAEQSERQDTSEREETEENGEA